MKKAANSSGERPSWDETILSIARIISLRSTCSRLNVGAVAVSQDMQILATGYNGAPTGKPHCVNVGCLLDDGGHCIRAIHAEMNVIASAAKYGVPLRGASLYLTHAPCERCSLAIIQVGFISVLYNASYRTSLGVQELKDGGIRCIHLEK